MDDLDYASPQVEAALRAANSIETLETALQAVLALQWTLGNPAVHGRKLFCRGLDALVPDVARRLGLPDIALPAGGGDALIVATQFYNVGGHTRVAEDISAILGPDKTVAVLTDAFGKMRHRQLLGIITEREKRWQRSLLLLGAKTAVEKIIELYSLVSALRPGRIFLLAHHMDIVATTALWPFRGIVEFVHHANYLPSLGATLPFGRHVDLTSICHRCCAAAGLRPFYAGMTVGVPDVQAGRHPFSTPGRVRFATSGSANKFAGRRAYDWGDYAAAALAIEGAEFVHFGPVDDAIRGIVTAALSRAGIDPARYVFAGSVPSIAHALIDQEIDVYLGSYPEAGSKASLEAMAMGYEPIVPMDADLPVLMRAEFATPTWVEINRPEELAGAVTRTSRRTAEDIAGHGALMKSEMNRFRNYVRD